jgi:hypothetical protein
LGKIKLGRSETPISNGLAYSRRNFNQDKEVLMKWAKLERCHDTQPNSIHRNDIRHYKIQHNDIHLYDIQHNDTQQNDIHHYDIQHNDTQHNDTQRNDIHLYDIQHYEIQSNDTQLTAFIVMTLGIMKFSIMPLSITTLSL